MENSNIAFPEILTIKNLAKYLQLSRSKIYSLIHINNFPFHKIGRQYRFYKSEIDEWFKKQE